MHATARSSRRQHSSIDGELAQHTQQLVRACATSLAHAILALLNFSIKPGEPHSKQCSQNSIRTGIFGSASLRRGNPFPILGPVPAGVFEFCDVSVIDGPVDPDDLRSSDFIVNDPELRQARMIAGPAPTVTGLHGLNNQVVRTARPYQYTRVRIYVARTTTSN